MLSGNSIQALVTRVMIPASKHLDIIHYKQKHNVIRKFNPNGTQRYQKIPSNIYYYYQRSKLQDTFQFKILKRL